MKLRIFGMTPWSWYLCGFWYPFHARLDALAHVLRGHRLHWRDDVALWTGRFGEIWCEGCPDCGEKGSNLCFWVRYSRIWHRAAIFICGLMGHRGAEHPQQGTGRYDEAGRPIMEDCLDEWYCPRCIGDVEPPAATEVAV